MISVRDSGDYEALVRGHIVSFASLEVLRVLRAHGPRAPEEIAAHLGVTTSEASRALSALAAVGLVERAAHGPGARFVLTTQPSLRAAVEALLDRCEDERHFRTCLVLDILRRMSAEVSRR